MKIAFIGAGNMAAALIGGLLGRGIAASGVLAIDPDEAARARLEAAFGIQTAAAVSRLDDCEAIVLAVKPQVLAEVCRTLAPALGGQLVISIAAGIRAADIARFLGGHNQVIRAMPNTPALVGMGVTGLAALPAVDADGRTLAARVLEAVGKVVWCDSEDQIDAITAISGSGPAYVFYFMEALERMAQELGFDTATARTLAISTVSGAARLAADSPDSLAMLRERVTSKGGTTAAALAAFAERGVADGLAHGMRAAHARAGAMARELGRG
jgi:pyrroline-5-carboxylate reductase